MESDKSFNNITDILNNIPDNYMIMEETIDLEVQREYFEKSKELVEAKDDESIEDLIAKIDKKDTDIEDQKTTLAKLAMVDSVEAFRAIEKYNQAPVIELKEWAVLAFQQSRMLMQSSLLDEQQVFISTGLGGKNNKLRYFLIFPYNNCISLNDIQEKMLESELKFTLNQNEGEFEDINFHEKYTTSTILLPLEANIPTLIQDIITECNQIGNFLNEDVLITNMKQFNHKEITDILEQNEKPED